MRKRRYEPQKCNGGKNVIVWDNETGECLGFTAQIVGRLNLQEDKLNDLSKENEQLREILKDIVVATDETYTKNTSMFKVALVLDYEKYREIRRCIE